MHREQIAINDAKMFIERGDTLRGAQAETQTKHLADLKARICFDNDV